MKNIITAELKHRYFRNNKIQPFSLLYDDVEISFSTPIKGSLIVETLMIELKGTCSLELLENQLISLLDLLFLYLGSLSGDIEVIKNHQTVDTSKYAKRYCSDSYYSNPNRVLCPIDNTTLTPQTLYTCKSINQEAIASLQYLLTSAYKELVTDHKITLLLHTVDAIIPDSTKEVTKKLLKIKFPSKKIMGDYYCKAYHLFEEAFQTNYGVYTQDIFKVLKTKPDKFPKIMADTRNGNSHFLPKGIKKEQIKDGKHNIIYFELLFCIIRVYLIRQINAPLDEKRLQEFLFCIHDWIVEINNSSANTPYLSETYRHNQSLKPLEQCFAKERFVRQIEMFFEHITTIETCLIYYEQINDFYDEKNEKRLHSSDFFNSVTRAYDVLIVCELGKMFDKASSTNGDHTISLYTILKQCHDLFLIDDKQYESLLEKITSSSDNLDMLKEYRNKIFAHADTKYFTEPRKILEKYPFDFSRFIELNHTANEILCELYTALTEKFYTFSPVHLQEFDLYRLLEPYEKT